MLKSYDIYYTNLTNCRRAAATICPPTGEERGGAQCPRPSPPPWAPMRLAPPSRRQRSSSFPRPTCSHAYRCSHLTRQYGGEQSGLVTSTFDLLTLKVVSESCVTWATSVPILVFLGLFVLDLGQMYATDRRQTDVRQTDVRQHRRFMSPPIRSGA